MSARAPHIAVVRHEDGCPLGLFDPWLGAAGARVTFSRPYAGERLPDVTAADGLIVLGGSMSATDDARFPWLAPVRGLLAEAVDAGLPTLGICLGHQLLAVARGGEVARNPAGKQMGVLPVGFGPAATTDHLFGSFAANSPPQSVQWNDDIVVRLPPDATLLAATPEGIPQAMRVGAAAWGVQFHPEVDAAIVTAWAEEHGPPTPAQAAALEDIAARSSAVQASGRALAAGFTAIAARRRPPRATGSCVTVT